MDKGTIYHQQEDAVRAIFDSTIFFRSRDKYKQTIVGVADGLNE